MQFKLSNIRVVNCGPIRDVTIDLCSDPVNGCKPLDVCIVAGPNGCGKTTVFEVVAYLFNLLSLCPHGNQPSDDSFSKPFDYLQLDVWADATPFSIFVDRVGFNDAKLQTERFGYRRRANSTHYEEERSPFARQLHGFTHAELHQAQRCAEFDGTDQLSRNLSSVLLFEHLRGFANVQTASMVREETRFALVRRFGFKPQYAGSFESWLIFQDYSEPAEFSKVLNYLNTIKLGGKSFSVDRKAMKVVVHTANEDTHYLHQMSSGEQNILFILAELRRVLSHGAIVMIDEIETGLHPAYQHRLAQGLLQMQKDMPFQLLISTHAPAFLDVFGERCTRLMGVLA
jgi:predicted ATPase